MFTQLRTLRILLKKSNTWIVFEKIYTDLAFDCSSLIFFAYKNIKQHNADGKPFINKKKNALLLD